LALELPAVTVADRVTAALVLLAGVFGARVLALHGQQALAAMPAVLALGTVAIQVRRWTRSRERPAVLLERLPSGALQVSTAGETPARATLGHRTRRLGPSVFLEVDFAFGSRRMRYARWLTRFDVPAVALRRWSVVLPSCGRAACS
jgi:hypothetical protein